MPRSYKSFPRLYVEADLAAGEAVTIEDGQSDYLLKVLVRADDSYERVHRQILSALPGVQRLVTQFTIRTLATDESG